MLSLIFLIGLGYGSIIPENTETAVDMPLISNDDVPLVAKLDTKNLNKAIKTYIDKTVDKAVIDKITELKLDKYSTVIQDKDPRDCEDVKESASGIYQINPSGIRSFDAYCDMNTAGGGWLVFQRRQDGSVDFFRNWTDYKNGFGDLTGEFWLGNSKIHEITTHDEYELYIHMEDLDGDQRYARYETFFVGDVQSKFTLQVGDYLGDGGLGYGSVIPENPDTEVEMPLISNDDVPLVAKFDTKNLDKAIKTYINKTMEMTVMDKFSELKLDILSKIKTEKYPRDCEDVRESRSGIYKIYPSNIRGFETYCDMTTAGGGWLVFQKRQDGSVDFFRNWTDYKNGFGDLTGEFWLGNSRIHEITTKDEYELYILMEDFAGETRYARYKTFYIGDIQSKFIIDIGEYSGNAGNSLGTAQHSSQPFSTLDRGSSSNCAKAHFGGWWYKNCHHSNLNGLYLNGSHKSYADGIEWYHWKGYNYSLKKTQMMIRRRR